MNIQLEAAKPGAAGATSPQPKVAVVIPTLNEERAIRGVLAALQSDRLVAGRTHFIVADGGSSDRTAEIVREIAAGQPNLHLLPNPKRIQSAAMNLAATTLGGECDVIVRCDAHAEYPPHFIPDLLQSLAASGADSVVVPMDSVGDGCLQRAVAWVSNTPVGTGGSRHRAGTKSGFVDHGHHAAFSAARYRRIGGYDETFTHNEDAEYDCRLRKDGGRIYLDAGIRVTYHPRSSLRSLARQYWNYGRGRARTVLRHRDSLRLRQAAVPGHVVLFVLSILATPLTPLAWAWPVLYIAVLAAASLAITAKQRSLCGLLAGPAAAIMHFTWGSGFLLEFLRAALGRNR